MTTPHDTGLALSGTPEPDDIITDVDLDNYHGARRLLAEAIPKAVAAGCSGNQIAARLSGVFGQQAVINYCTALRTAETVRKAVALTELRFTVYALATGPDSPVGAWLGLDVDPSQIDEETLLELPGRVRQALAPRLLTTDPADDSWLRRGGRVRVEKIRPKS